MPPSSESHQIPTSPGRAGLSPADLRRRVHARLAEKIDVARTRHKPLSLVRQEARRLIDQFLDTECPTLTRSDRDRFVEDILTEGVGYGPFEELFRDEGVKEIQFLGPGEVIVRKNDAWQQSPIKLRDAEQLRQVLARFAEVGEPLSADGPLAGGVDVRLANGFRVVAILPPEGAGYTPLVWLIRGVPPPVPAVGSGTVSAPRSGYLGARQTPRASDSGLVSMASLGVASDVPPGSLTSRHTPPATGRMPQPPSSGPVPGQVVPVSSGPPSGRMPKPPSTEGTQDPLARDRQRITERIIRKLAGAGVYDLAAIPLPELRRFVLAAVQEYSDAEKLGFGAALQERLALEILAGMNR